MNRHFLILGILMSFTAQTGLAQSGPDYQLRIPTHFQFVENGNEQGHAVGLAGWAIFPNVMADKGQGSFLFVAGALWRTNPSGSWIEFMVGNRFNRSGYTDPLVNIRFSNNHPKGVNLYGEAGYFFREIRKRSYALVAVDVPVPIGKSGLRLGIESENTHFPTKPDSWGIGPRVVIPLPPVLFSKMRFSVATAYQCFRTDRAFIRTYVTTTIKNP